jgi:hypothetical protein
VTAADGGARVLNRLSVRTAQHRAATAIAARATRFSGRRFDFGLVDMTLLPIEVEMA